MSAALDAAALGVAVGAGTPLGQLALSADDWAIHAEVVRRAHRRIRHERLDDVELIVQALGAGGINRTEPPTPDDSEGTAGG